MKIWVIGRYYPLPRNSMMGSFELEQAKMLAKYGNEVTFLSFGCFFRKKWALKKKWETEEWQDDNIKVLHRDWWILPAKLHCTPKMLKKAYWRAFLEEAERRFGKPDVIHIHYPSIITNAEAVIEYAAKKCKLVCTEHYTKVLTKEISQSEIDQLTKYVRESDAFICVGDPLKKSVEDLTGIRDKVVVIPNIANDCFFREKSDHKGFVFVAVGRLVPVKQFDKIITAFKYAFQFENDVELKIIGNGPEKEKLIELAQGDERIRFKGVLDREKTSEEISSSDVLVCYSRLETFGVPVIEAWASGKPVIASDCLGFLEYWDDQYGTIVPWNDQEKLINAMRKYKKSGALNGNEISQFAKNNFSERIIYEKLSSVFEKSLKDKQS